MQSSKTDTLYFSNAIQKYTTYIQNTVDFIFNEQLCDRKLWSKFVDQYRIQEDGFNGGWRGEYWGKMMRGAVLVYEYIHREDLFDILTETVNDMLTVAESDGRVSSYKIEHEFSFWDMWCRKYVMLGLEYYCDICRDEKLKERIVNFIKGCGDYIIKHIGKEDGKTRITYTSKSWYGVNSSSILESIVWLYRLTNDKKYLDFATYIIEEGGAKGINIFELAYENKIYPYQYGVSKAYEMISCFEGLIEYYRITKIEKYKTAAINFGKAVLKTDMTVIGTCGCTHELFDHSSARQTSAYPGIMQETCVTVTFMKYCSQLLRISGDSIFADAMEQSFFNAYLGSLNTKRCISLYMRKKWAGTEKEKILKDVVLPFDSYSPLICSKHGKDKDMVLLYPGKRGEKIAGNQILSDGTYYGCCACIGAAGVGIFAKSAVMTYDYGIILNFYNNGNVNLDYNGNKVNLNIETKYPADGKINIALAVNNPVVFDLKIRVPSWVKINEIYVSEKFVYEHGYIKLRKLWENENKISINFQMNVEVHYPQIWDTDYVYTSVNPDTRVISKLEVKQQEKDRHYISLSRGPLTLCADEKLGKSPASEFNFDISNGHIDYINLNESNEKTDLDCIIELKFKDISGKPIYLIDYSSAGKEWGTLMAAWLPVN